MRRTRTREAPCVTIETKARAYRWTIAAVLAALALFVAALSADLYNATSPPSLGWHVVLRKAYSVIAFAVIGYLAARALHERGRPVGALGTVATVALYSAAIELGQYLTGVREGAAYNALDIGCGALGGALAAIPARRSM